MREQSCSEPRPTSNAAPRCKQRALGKHDGRAKAKQAMVARACAWVWRGRTFLVVFLATFFLATFLVAFFAVFFTVFLAAFFTVFFAAFFLGAAFFFTTFFFGAAFFFTTFLVAFLATFLGAAFFLATFFTAFFFGAACTNQQHRGSTTEHMAHQQSARTAGTAPDRPRPTRAVWRCPGERNRAGAWYSIPCIEHPAHDRTAPHTSVAFAFVHLLA